MVFHLAVHVYPTLISSDSPLLRLKAVGMIVNGPTLSTSSSLFYNNQSDINIYHSRVTCNISLLMPYC